MDPAKLRQRLTQAAHSSDIASELQTLIDEASAEGADLGSVEVILRFMEENPELDLGAPGPLVHFVERFHGAGYEDKLLRSLSRRPTVHTVWMLNRVLNGTKESRERDRLIDALRAAQNHPMVDEQTKQQAARFLARLGSGLT